METTPGGAPTDEMMEEQIKKMMCVLYALIRMSEHFCLLK